MKDEIRAFLDQRGRINLRVERSRDQCGYVSRGHILK
jgi:hypothetical protein